MKHHQIRDEHLMNFEVGEVQISLQTKNNKFKCSFLLTDVCTSDRFGQDSRAFEQDPFSIEYFVAKVGFDAADNAPPPGTRAARVPRATRSRRGAVS